MTPRNKRTLTYIAVALGGLLLGLSVVVVFLVLAALYESWTIPLAAGWPVCQARRIASRRTRSLYMS